MAAKKQSSLGDAAILWMKMHMYILLAGFLTIAGMAAYYYFYISRPSYEVGALHIQDIIKTNELKTWQAELDVLVNVQTLNGKYFSALTTTKVEAGVKMDDVIVTEDEHNIHITIPASYVITKDINDKEKIIRLSNAMDQSTINAVKIFAGNYATNMLKKNGGLAVAQNEAKRIITHFAKNVVKQKEKQIDVSLLPVTENKFETITVQSPRTGLFLDHFPLQNKWDFKVFTSQDMRYPFFQWKRHDHDSISLYSLGMVKNGPLASQLKCSQADSQLADQFNPLNPKLKFKMLAVPQNFSASFCWQVNGQVYAMQFQASDESAYEEELPDAMMLAYGVRYQPDFHQGGGSHALGGIPRSEWIKVSFTKQMAYFLDVLRDGPSIDLTPMKSYRGVKFFAEFDKTFEITTLSTVSGALVGEPVGGVLAYKYVHVNKGYYENKIKKIMDEFWDSIPVKDHPTIKVILFDPQAGYTNFHRQRIIALSPNRIYFFLPKRALQGKVFAKLPVFIMARAKQEETNTSISYDNENHQWEVDGEAMRSVRFNRLLDSIASRNLFDLIKIN